MAAERAPRSIAGQIEFWARLGRAVEPLLDGSRSLAPRRSGRIVPLSHLLATVDSAEGRQRVAEYLKSTPFPHFEAVSNERGLLVRIEADGARTVGQFVDGEFRAVE
jgi:hypothetical protein